MKRLLLLRHAKSSRDGPGRDHARPLAPRGIWAAEAMADGCAGRLQDVDLVLCSTAIRAHETLRLFERQLPPSSKTSLDDGLYLASRKALQTAVQKVDDEYETVLLVGHEPGLSDLAESLCADEGRRKALRRLAKGFKTASLATIDLPIDRWCDLRPGSARLRSVVRPKDLH